MYGALLGLHLIVCLALVAVILVQSGKGGGLAGGAFGGATQTVFGGRGATDFITKATIWLGIAFFLTSLVLAKITTAGNHAQRSLIQEQARKAQRGAPAQVPAAPGGGAPAPVPSGGTPAPSGGGTP
jgi:preprotein translocase subunit SecG